MNDIIRLSINVCIVLIISSLIELLTEGSKYSIYVKSTVTIVIISLIVNFILNFRFEIKNDFNVQSYSIDNHEVWNKVLAKTSEKLEDEMYSLCQNNGIYVDSIKVTLETDLTDISLVSVDIHGDNGDLAKNLIGSYFNITPAYINIDGD